ncbi:MAG: hypothetical protein NC204_05720 [Candidatus Amulumruptor caecigallinarius]|nr:hypothetical protein [Candidatus Amulumruptor caecigallinarius]
MGTIIKGNRGLAEALNVHYNTIGRWRKEGLLSSAIVVELGRTVRYDLDLVKQALTYRKNNMI